MEEENEHVSVRGSKKRAQGIDEIVGSHNILGNETSGNRVQSDGGSSLTRHRTCAGLGKLTLLHVVAQPTPEEIRERKPPRTSLLGVHVG